MSKRLLWLLPLLLLALGLCYHFFIVSSSSQSSAKTRQMVATVRLETVQRVVVANQLPLVGKLAASQSVTITPEVSGRVTALPSSKGGLVASGTRLLQLDDARQRAVHAEAEAFLVNEQRKLSDLTRLARKGVVTQIDLDGQAAVVAQAQARRDITAFELSQRRLLAPFAGRVGLYDISLGALVNPGEVLLHLDDLSVMRLDLAVPERYLAQLQLGMPLTGHAVAWPDATFAGVIRSIDSRVESETLNIKVRLEFANDDERLRPGMLMQVDLPFASEQQPLIPVQAIEFQGNERFVYLLGSDQHVQRRKIELGEAQGSRIAVLSGLQGGEPLVVEGVVALHDGMKVKVVPAAKQPGAGTTSGNAVGEVR